MSTIDEVRAGTIPRDYSPRVHAAISVYMACVLLRKPISIEEVANAAGMSYDSLRHYLKGIYSQIIAIQKKEGGRLV